MAMNAQDVLDFWFGELSPSDWFSGGESIDELIRSFTFCLHVLIGRVSTLIETWRSDRESNPVSL